MLTLLQSWVLHMHKRLLVSSNSTAFRRASSDSGESYAEVRLVTDEAHELGVAGPGDDLSFMDVSGEQHLFGEQSAAAAALMSCS